MRLTTLIFLFLIYSKVCFAQSCTPIRLDQGNGPLSRVPVMDQDGVQICYAYSAAQLIDAWRFSHGADQSSHITSPIALAIAYSNDKGHAVLNNNWPHGAINVINKVNSCSHDLIRDRFGSKDLREFLGELRTLFDDYKRINTGPTRKSPAEILLYADKVNCTLKNAGILADSIPKVFEINDALKKITYVGYLSELFEGICKKSSVDIEGIPRSTVVWGSNYKKSLRLKIFKGKTHQLLSQDNPQPVGIGYCADILRDKNSVGVTDAGKINRTSCMSYHSSVVVGRRQKGNKCQFLVRNSYGASCHAYPDWECNDGQIWVDEDKLAENTSEIFYIGK